MKIFRNFFGKFGLDRPQKGDDLVEILELFPFEGPVYVVGDIHGCLDAFRKIEAIIFKDMGQFPNQATIILLGDVVDRGPQTAALIDHLLSRQRGGLRVITLRGNHEEMMLEFLSRPEANISWLEFGGLETLASYGIDIAGIGRMPSRKLAQVLAAHIPQSHIAFLQNTYLGLRLGPFLLTHAGADADKPLIAQPMRALLWGSAGQIAPQDLILVHGHFVVAAPQISRHCLSIDTGAYFNGRLTCLRLLPTARPAIVTLTETEEFKDLADDEL